MLNEIQLAYLFRTVNGFNRLNIPVIPHGLRIENIIHEFETKYPVGKKSAGTIRALQMFESFIHSVKVQIRKNYGEETIKNIFRSVVPKVCEVQTLTLTLPENSSTIFNDFDIPVESVIVETPTVNENDIKKIIKNISKVENKTFSSICIRAWHNITKEQLDFILETQENQSCTWEVGNLYIVFHRL